MDSFYGFPQGQINVLIIVILGIVVLGLAIFIWFKEKPIKKDKVQRLLRGK